MNKTACLLATKSKSYGSMNMQVNMHTQKYYYRLQ